MGRLLRTALVAAVLAAPAAARAEGPPAEPPVGDPAMATAGTVLSVSGSFGLLVGTALTVSAATCEEDCDRRHAWPVALVSGLAVAASVPLLVIGVEPGGAQVGVTPRPVRLALRAAPTALALSGSF